MRLHSARWFAERRAETLLQFGIEARLVIGRRFCRQTETFACPGSKIDAFATFAAKRAKCIAGPVHTFTAAIGTHHELDGRRGFFHFGHGFKQRSTKQTFGSGAERQFESRIISACMQPVIAFVTHEAHRDHQAVAANFGNQT